MEKLGETIRIQLKKKLAQRLQNPMGPADRLHGLSNQHKIKLRSSGYRIVYENRRSRNPRVSHLSREAR